MSNETSSLSWGEPSFPSPSNTISLVIERDLQLADNSTPLPTLALVTRLVRILQARKLREYWFRDDAGTPIGEGATYQVAMVESVGQQGPASSKGEGRIQTVAKKIAKFTIPKRSQMAEMYRQEWHSLRVVSFEIELLSHPAIQKHPHIASLAGFSWNESAGGYTPCLVMEMATYGNARSFRSSRDLTEGERSTLCGHVASGLDFLHASQIIHGDIKQENILVFSDGQSVSGFVARITDFERSPQTGPDTRYTGTTMYNAPEIQRGCTDVEPGQLWRSDIFAFGLLVLEVFSGCRTYDVIEPRIPLRRSVETGASSGAEEALSLALEVSGHFRIISLAAMETCQAILKLTLPHDPAQRLPNGWQEIREHLGYAVTDVTPLDANALVSTRDSSTYSVTELYRDIDRSGQDDVAGALWGDLEHASETMPSNHDRGKAAFSLFICYALGSYAPCKSIEQALSFVTFAADTGYPPAFLCGKRVFEANQLPVPRIFAEEPTDPDLQEILLPIQNASSAGFYSKLVQLLLPRTLRAQAADALGLPPDHQASQEGFSEWMILKQNEMGTAAFLDFAEATLLFHHAIIRSDLAGCQTLLDMGCNANKANPDGIIPLQLTVLCAEVDIFDFLLAHGAVVQLNWNSAVTLLHWLVVLPEERVLGIVRAFLGRLDDDNRRFRVCSAELDFVLDDIGLSLSGSPLEWAISCRNLTVVKALTAPGVPLPVRPKKLVSLAAGLGCVDILRHLLETDRVLRGLSRLDRYEIFTSLGNQGTYLARWLMHGNSHNGSVSQVIDTLEEFGIRLPLERVHKIDGQETTIGIMSRAAVGSHIYVLEELLRRGLSVHENRSTKNEVTVLDYALRCGGLHGPEHRFMESIQLLLRSGADTGARPVLHAACKEDIPLDVFKFILKQDWANVNTEYSSTTPLLALLQPPVKPDAFAKVRALVEAGGNINAEVSGLHRAEDPWKYSWTPLACSLYFLDWGVAEYLLDNGASFEYGSSSGCSNTVLHLLVFKALKFCPGFQQGEYSELINIIYNLLDRADARDRGLINMINHQGIDALRLSVMFGLVEITRILLKKEYGISSDIIKGVSWMMPSLLLPAMAPKFVALDKAEQEMIKSRGLPCYMYSEYEKRLQEIFKLLENTG